MFNSGKKVKDLIAELRDEVDIAVEIPTSTYLEWLTSLEHLCYSEIIKEQREISVLNPTTPVTINELPISDDEAPIRFEDIYTVYADDVQLIKSTLASGRIFPDTFYKDNDNLGFNSLYNTRELKIVYLARPKVKTDDNGNVMFPVEFLDLVKAKLRGEAYKLADENNQSAKWINDYNIKLEHFKVWCNNRASQFGM